MPTDALFISYGHLDMRPTNWLERLKLYLAPLRREDVVDIWDDSEIRVGTDWRQEIESAITRAESAILLVGPAFLASEFINRDELPALLASVGTRGTKLYPLVVAYCGYKRSRLGKFQAFNDPDHPLEAISVPEQNKILNQISLVVDEDLRSTKANSVSSKAIGVDTRGAMREISAALANTWTAFAAQCRRRDHLVEVIRLRLAVRDDLEYEQFFFRYFGKLNDEERFEFDQIRVMTEGPIYSGNQRILDIIEKHQQVLEEIPRLADLRQHLVFWLNKYEKFFVRKPEMCVLYTGVEDGVPFPNGIDGAIGSWIREHA
jgi:hypothetical protein